jgi:hypothetical protein
MKESEEVNQKNSGAHSAAQNDVQSDVPQGLVPLQVPVPSNLERAFGYAKSDISPELVRWVAWWWEPSGDEFCYHDGHALVIGAAWAAWLAYTRHKAVSAGLGGFDFGSVELEPAVCFVLDRKARKAYAAPKASAFHLVREQWKNVAVPQEHGEPVQDAGENAPTAVTQDDLNELLKMVFSETVSNRREVLNAALEAEHAEQDAMLQELDAFVDAKTVDSEPVQD